MHGLDPVTHEAIRPVGANGTRTAGIDLTFSTPKDVSALWATAGEYRRAQIETAHRNAVKSALERTEREVASVRRKTDNVVRFEKPRRLLAAEAVHTTSRHQPRPGGDPDLRLPRGPRRTRPRHRRDRTTRRTNGQQPRTTGVDHQASRRPRPKDLDQPGGRRAPIARADPRPRCRVRARKASPIAGHHRRLPQPKQPARRTHQRAGAGARAGARAPARNPPEADADRHPASRPERRQDQRHTGRRHPRSAHRGV
ncbi:MAG: relaxase domain-containing protein [Solirubrobacteraceae bacterium]